MRAWVVLTASVITLLLVVGISIVPADAAANIFLKVPDISGESVVPGHEDEIEILSFNFGVDNVVVPSGGQRSSGNPNFQDATFTKQLDKSSPKLFLDVATGKTEPEAILVVARQTGGGTVDFVKFTFTDVIVTSYSIGGSEGEVIPTDFFSLNFAKIKFEYTPLDSKGGLGNPEPPAEYDLAAQKSL